MMTNDGGMLWVSNQRWLESRAASFSETKVAILALTQLMESKQAAEGIQEIIEGKLEKGLKAHQDFNCIT